MLSFLYRLMPASWRENHPLIPVIRLNGVIGQAGSFRSGLTMNSASDILDQAFKLDCPAVVLAINSPGGSPVQSKLIHDRIRQLAEEYERDVIAIIDDVGASGGYMLACAADTIISDPSSIIGSIGVVSSSFGFDKLIKKYGIDRRIYTAGESKSMLDPFQPEKKEDIEHLKSLQKDVHEVFVNLVKKSRGEKLSDNEELFTGKFWSGVKAKELGLIDDITDMRGYLRRHYGDKMRTITLTPGKVPFYKKLTGNVEETMPALLSAKEITQTIEEKSLWARYGL